MIKIYLAGPSAAYEFVERVGEALLQRWDGIEFTQYWWDTARAEARIDRDSDERDQVLAHCAAVDLAAIREADLVIGIVTEDISTGLHAELMYARAFGIPTFTLEFPPEMEVIRLQQSCLFLSQVKERFTVWPVSDEEKHIEWLRHRHFEMERLPFFQIAVDGIVAAYSAGPDDETWYPDV